jgi:hypothetical protein
MDRSAETAVKEVWLLNTAGSGHGMADRARIQFLSGNSVVLERSERLKAWPTWNETVLDTPVRADRIRIYIDAFRGNGGGLNEIKIVH